MRLPIPDGDGSTFAGMLSHEISSAIAEKLEESIKKFEIDALVDMVSGSGGEWYSC
jgi:hypothetical protein